MTKDTMKNKSQLAKLLATENIEVQENAVQTASFDVVNRVLTSDNNGVSSMPEVTPSTGPLAVTVILDSISTCPVK